MVTNFVGIQRDFTVPCGVRADVGVRVKRADGSPAAVGKATWQLGIWKDGAAAVASVFAELLPSPDGAGAGDLFWRFPALAKGLWRYELTARGSDGEVARVFYGVIGSAEASDIVAAAEVVGVKGWRMLEVLLPAVAGGKVEAHWLAGDYVLALCEQARDAADRAEDAADRAEDALDAAVDAATKRAEAAADRAEDAAERAEDAAERAEDDRHAIEVKFQETDAFIDGFYDVALRVIVPNQTTGTWWIGGRDSKQPFQGEQGYSPQISTSGYWLVWRDGQVVESDTRARAEDGFSPYVDSAGYWVYVDPLTGQVGRGPLAAGKDGLDGTAVRFILVDSYEEIPQSGETCNGGFRYLVRKEGWAVIGEPAATGNGEWEAWELPAYLLPSEFTHLRVPGVLNANSTPAYLMVRTTGGEVLGVSQNAVSWAVGDVVTWEFAEAVRVPNGATVQLFLRTTNEGVTGAVPDEGVRLKSLLANVGVCRVRYANVWYGERTPYLLAWGAGASEFYEVYAWVEHDGSAGWVRVDRTNELATARVYGLMKYGTDMTVVGGAPVGQNAEGQACVPVASYTALGTVKPSGTTISTDGGGTHMSADGQMLVDKADTQRFGAVKLSCGEQIPDADDNIGLRADGKIGVRRATLDEFGSVRLGSRLQQVASIPYLLSVGSITDETKPGDTGKLANNLLIGGALQHGLAAHWTSGGRVDMVGIDFGNLTAGVYYLGLYTSPSFKQSQSNGLELNEATTSLLGGVRKMTTLGSGSDVPTGSAVLAYLNENYYTKSQTYTRSELTRDGGIIELELKEKLPIYAAKELVPYLKKADAAELYAPISVATRLNTLSSTVASNKTSADNSFKSVFSRLEELEKSDDFVRVGNSGIHEFWEGTVEEFSMLPELDANVSYIVLEG